MYTKLLAAAVLLVAATALTGAALARPVSANERVLISLMPNSSDFRLVPLGKGALASDGGTMTSCCWSRHFFQRDGESIEVDNPLVTFTGKHGSFTWLAEISFVDSGNGYTVGTGTWNIVRGSGVYQHLTGHGRIALIQSGGSDNGLTMQSEGLFDLGS
jgi:hypothetical protein